MITITAAIDALVRVFWAKAAPEMKQHIILGKDRREVETERDKWLAENPDMKVVKLHPPTREPMGWLTLIGGRDVPRFSITVEYEEVASGLSTAT